MVVVAEDLGTEILAVSEGILVVTSCMTAVGGIHGPSRSLFHHDQGMRGTKKIGFRVMEGISLSQGVLTRSMF